MSIVRIKKSEQIPFVILNASVMNDTRLSFRAKGIHAYLMSRPDDWNGSIELIAQESQEGRKALRSAIQELEDAGYACLKRRRGKVGHLGGWDLILSDAPNLTIDEKSEDSILLDERINYLKSLIPQGLPISGYIYILEAGPFFKIGKAQVADKRIIQIPLQLPFKITVRHLIGCENYQTSEHLLHDKYDSKRTNGEWFLLDEQDLQELQAIRFMPSASLED